MKYFLELIGETHPAPAASGSAVLAVSATVAAMGELPSWIRNVEANSAIEAAFFRMMSSAGRSGGVSSASEGDASCTWRAD